MYRDHRKGPGGPPGGATHPGGPHGLKWEENQPLVGWCAPLGPPLRLGLETLGVGGAPLGLGGTPPIGRHPPRRSHLLGPAPPKGPYITRGRGRAAAPLQSAHPFPLATPLPPADAWRSPAGIPAASTTTSSCCWIFINLSFPLAGSRRRRHHADRMCVERGCAVRSALGSPVIWIMTSTTPSTPFP